MEILLHIGYHKTGTKWLQRHVFATKEFAVPVHRGRVRSDFVSVNPFEFDATALAARYKTCIEEATVGGGYPVLSVERLAGRPHSGGFDARLIADRLASVWPSARILIVIRAQREILGSTYKEYVRMGGAMSLRQYTTLPTSSPDRMPLFRFDHFEYHRLIDYYQSRFSPASVLVLPQEMLAAEPVEFVRRIGEHIGVELPDPPLDKREHESSSALACAMKRHANRRLVRDGLNPAGRWNDRRVNSALRSGTDGAASLLRPVERAYERRFAAAIDAVVGDRYRQSNTETGRLIGLDLAQWGYDTAT